MKIKSIHPETQGPFVIIEDADFDSKTMTEYEPEIGKVRSKNK